MTDSRTLVIWGQVAAHAAAHGHPVSVADVCAVAAGSAGLAGGWLAAARGGDPDFVVCVTSLISEQLAELQLMLGEGPCHDVLASAAPVLAADLGDAELGRRWPGFTPAARQLGAGAVFAFPLAVGAIRAGVLGLYRGSPGSLPDRQLGDLLILADMATVMLLGSARGDAETNGGSWLNGQARDLAVHRAEIDQATGMLTVQLDVSAAEAFARLRAYAYSQDRRLADVAGDIVARRLRLARDKHPGDGP
ncbi:MAG TPA: GAF and ANTAR domain-containing protein [Streptosporangiaceae bacterium]|nr:GAF and ANTAR domain-containing protein [Streptosporangiaceae bacterium]